MKIISNSYLWSQAIFIMCKLLRRSNEKIYTAKIRSPPNFIQTFGDIFKSINLKMLIFFSWPDAQSSFVQCMRISLKGINNPKYFLPFHQNIF
jgi:hypothetical protein